MAKKPAKIDTAQLSLFDYISQLASAPQGQPREGSLDIRDALRESLTDAIRSCSLSRWELAGRMSHLVGVEISKYTIDAWTAESKEGHRIPAEYIPAFCKATGSQAPMKVIAEAAGVFALPGPEALRAEIQKFAEAERKARAEKRKRELFLQEIEK
ncbi:MAG: hypothetical protein ABIL58_20125 [Pseudomonadota bacterium]